MLLLADGEGLETRGHRTDLLVGEAAVGLADGEELVAAAHGEGVVAEHAGAPAVAALGSDDHDVERRERLLDLQPREAADACGVGSIESLEHESLEAARACGVELRIER